MIANPANATLTLSPAGAAIIQDDEDSRGPALVAFKPTPNDVWTIAWGHTQGGCEGDTCTVAPAQAWFLQAMAWAQAAVLGAVLVPLNHNQFDALVGFTENDDGRMAISLAGIARFVLGDDAGSEQPFRICAVDFAPYAGDFMPGRKSDTPLRS